MALARRSLQEATDAVDEFMRGDLVVFRQAVDSAGIGLLRNSPPL
jgi:hypothetical protein